MSDTRPLRLCERCFGAIGRDEQYLRLAHIGAALPDGSIQWLDMFVHTAECVSPAQRRDLHRTGSGRQRAVRRTTG
ncbi:hypothetical protein [Pseudonocardia sp.]|jgi:hypothetical protein|uniref:hypothetical protein n=1 Tax=Pseudonocardia sp. TaxID=60912 RepID=UPI003D0DC707